VSTITGERPEVDRRILRFIAFGVAVVLAITALTARLVYLQVTHVDQFAAQAQALAWAVEAANEKYAADYPAAVGNHMTNTDSGPFMDVVPAISLRENERGTQIRSGWDPQWHQPTDLFTTYSDKDFRLGLNAAQTTLGAVATLTGATIKNR